MNMVKQQSDSFPTIETLVNAFDMLGDVSAGKVAECIANSLAVRRLEEQEDGIMGVVLLLIMGLELHLGTFNDSGVSIINFSNSNY